MEEDVMLVIADLRDYFVKAILREGRWSKIGPHQRARYLLKVADLIDQHADELAGLETLDNGKALSQARAIDILAAAETFCYYAGWCSKIYGETNPSDPSLFNYTLRESVGVCATCE